MLVYIATPYRADKIAQFEDQLAYTKRIAREEVLKGHDVIVPHLYYPSFLDDNDEKERTLGMKSAVHLMLRCDKVVVGVKFGKSAGVLNEINYANKHNILIEEVL